MYDIQRYLGDSLEKGTKSVTLNCHHNLWRVSHDRNCLEFSLTSPNVIKFTKKIGNWKILFVTHKNKIEEHSVVLGVIARTPAFKTLLL